MKLSHRQRLWYDTVIYILAAVAMLFAIVEISDSLQLWQLIINRTILFVFTLDYFIRLYLAKDKKEFFFHNCCDLIAIIPFSSFFRAFRLIKLLKFAKLTRLFAFLFRISRKIRVFLDTSGFRYMAYITALLIITGGVTIHFVEGMSLADGIWWAFVTASTVGYGDISPSTFAGRLVAMILMLGGIGLIGTLTSTITSYFLNKNTMHKGDSFRDNTIETIKHQLDNLDTLTEQDVDSICVLLKSFIKNK